MNSWRILLDQSNNTISSPFLCHVPVSSIPLTTTSKAEDNQSLVYLHTASPVPCLAVTSHIRSAFTIPTLPQRKKKKDFWFALFLG
jgi:hypothetical protein